MSAPPPHHPRFSPRMLLTPGDYQLFATRRDAGPAASWPLWLLVNPVGRRYLWRVLLCALGRWLEGPLHGVAPRIQAARAPLSPFTWLRVLFRLVYKLVRRARPLSAAQAARLREAAQPLHPEAQRILLELPVFQARLPHGWIGQYTAFGEIALKAGHDDPAPDLIRHEWAHHWWFHHLTPQDRAAFMEAIRALAAQPDLPEEMQPAQEIARAYLEGRNPRCRYGNKVFVVPLQSNDGYRVAYCFGFTDLEVHAYVAHMIRGDVRRLPPELRPFYAGFFPL